MQLSFSSYQIDFNRYELGKHNVKPIPKMTNAQVEMSNKTRNLPDGYYLMTKESNLYTKKGHLKDVSNDLQPSYKELEKPVMTIIKGEKDYTHRDMPRYFNTLPDGYEIENNILGTYLKKSTVKSALFNYYQTPIYVTLGTILSGIVFKLLKR